MRGRKFMRSRCLSAFAVTLPMFGMFALAAANSGCSFIFVRGPPSEPHQHRVVDCTSSRVAPILDTVFGSLEVVRTAIDIGASDASFQGQPFNKGTDIGLGLGFTALFLGSAVYGYIETERCDDMQSRFEAAESPGEEESSTPTPPSKRSKAAATAPSAESAVPTTGTAAREPKSFDNKAARVSIEKAFAAAAVTCHPKSDVPLRGEARLTFGVDGHVSGVTLEPAPADATVGECIQNSLRGASVPPFDGDPVVATKHFDLNP